MTSIAHQRPLGLSQSAVQCRARAAARAWQHRKVARLHIKVEAGGRAAAGNGGSGDGASSSSSSAPAADAAPPDSTLRSLSPEARQVFKEAQENIFALNRSRLRALDELRHAKEKIGELESKLEEAVSEASSASRQVADFQARSLTSTTYEDDISGGTFVAAASAPPGAQALVAGSSMAEPAAEPSTSDGPCVTVVYSTGWQSAFLHYNMDNKGWTAVPGKRMREGSARFPGAKMITVPGYRLEFVINDGGADWDSPNPWGEEGRPKNYVADGPGIWRLKNGKLNKLE